VIGTRLSHYEITSHLGSGGMGDVYQATDLKLGRSVAVKFLPENFSHDSERVARFQREARVLASLNHPNIASIYELEEIAGRHFLVMELVPGETLAERIARGAIPLSEALPIGKQIADALEAAHEQGIIHRDLKPSNIKVRPDGAVKVLDFGLAKAFESSATNSTLSQLPTVRMSATQAGVILGTAAYMSPEQARGRPVDKRTDIWSFGVVLHEMLTGRTLFHGDTLADTLAAVVTKPPVWDDVPFQVRRLLRQCLQKEPRDRLRDIGDAMTLVESAVEPAISAQAENKTRSALPWAVTGLLAAILATLGLIHFREQPSQQPELMRLQIQPGLTMGEGSPFQISPDGRKLVLVAAGPDGNTRLWIRSLDSLELRSLPGTETEPNIAPPFWSPDSRSVAYGVSGKLKRVDIATTGGLPETICNVSSFIVGGSWNRDGTIVFGANLGGIFQVPAKGGTSLPVTVLDASRGDATHIFPMFLPDGRHFIYLNVVGDSSEASGIYVGSLDKKPDQQSRERLVATTFGAAYVRPVDAASGVGRLIFRRGRSLMAQPFNDRTMDLSGEPVAIADGLSDYLSNGFFSVSSTGVLVHREGLGQNTQLTWFDRQGRPGDVFGEPGFFEALAVSPNNQQVVFSRLDAEMQSINLWLLDSQGRLIRFTDGTSFASFPVWSPDSSQIAYATSLTGRFSLARKLASGVHDPEVLLNVAAETGFPTPTSWSSDNRFLLYTLPGSNTGSDIWLLPLQDRKPIALVQTQHNESGGQFSADMRWIAYVSNDSGHDEVYVRSFSPDNPASPAAEKWPVSRDGGSAPKWRLDGKEITYIRPDGMLMSVAVEPGPAFHAQTPKELFLLTNPGGTAEVASDGRVLQGIPLEKNPFATFTVTLNWQALKK
jgi:serine/threonine protein kinase